MATYSTTGAILPSNAQPGLLGPPIPASGGNSNNGNIGGAVTTPPTSGGGTTTGTGTSTGSGSSTTGAQPAGNAYPAGIYGTGAGGSGTALGTITPDELTSNTLNGLIANNSQYIQQARNQAAQQANSRGLLNSSIAAGNAQGAAIQAALPIASADAQAAYGLQQTNLNNLSKYQTTNLQTSAQIKSASIGAAAQRYVANANNAGALQRQREDLAYSGEQAGLNYQRQLGLGQQQYQNQSALSSQNYGQNLGLDQFNLGSTLLTGMQNFSYSAGLSAMQNPAIMGDPQAFGGYMQFISNVFGANGTIDNIFNNLFGSYNGGTGNGG